ncbi:hypothetical protein [Flavilitoribacter nigricans]|uniref:Twin-arginine translocation signal domain-containing protein n=1 Tax=Flavilitoribacter nigricans (strain ATCC 23147 / DSM 23189 / NBRC 102662 / NCIMB 1420 / SS-2) TaxID=1122177 RepID=A0A2D0N2P6_FLAN2|nr:hypothetical protein [Flavilitoribacter nigricans]PHN02822.1 hypothetical protein CRP01_30035 [Flavilitoribacter nigricans DSM 23189 = NBRC 102662]
MKRRTFLKNTSLAAGMLTAGIPYSCKDAKAGASTDTAELQIQPITTGPQQHWFGYYDKQQIDTSGRYALGAEVEKFFRSPTQQDVLRVGLIDLEQGNTWREIGTSHSWGWQQGCMLQWIPGSDREVIWNDYGTDGFISKVYDIKTGETRTLPRAVYTLSPDGKFALSLDFDRLQFFRPGYGYPTKTPVTNWEKAPDQAGIYKMDLQSGASELILTYAQLAGLDREAGSVADYYHWFNHILVNPSGTRFIFLNRSRPVPSSSDMSAYRKENPEWNQSGKGHWLTRAITANTDGSDLYALNDSGVFSHFIWKGDDTICAWAMPDGGGDAGFYEFPDKTKNARQVGKGIMTVDGHNTYVPNTNYKWMLNDCYPQGEERLQELYLFHVPTEKKISIGKFHEPKHFTGEWRCDLHPRCDQQGKRVFFDSTHKGDQRQIYAVDISGIIAAGPR